MSVSYEGQAQENVENCMEVSIGMTVEQVVDIMGEPNNIKTYKGTIPFLQPECCFTILSLPTSCLSNGENRKYRFG